MENSTTPSQETLCDEVKKLMTFREKDVTTPQNAFSKMMQNRTSNTKVKPQTKIYQREMAQKQLEIIFTGVPELENLDHCLSLYRSGDHTKVRPARGEKLNLNYRKKLIILRVFYSEVLSLPEKRNSAQLAFDKTLSILNITGLSRSTMRNW